MASTSNRCHENISEQERVKIETLFHAGHKPGEIAQLLGRGRSTIYRELNRGKCIVYGRDLLEVVGYGAGLAHNDAQEKGRNRAHAIKLGKDYDLAKYIVEQMDGKTSPAAVAKRLKNKKFSCTVSKNTIYAWIENGYLGITPKVLPQGKKKKKKKTGKHIHNQNPFARSISTRAPEIALRDVIGHWEMDTVVGKAAGKNSVLLVLSERMSRFEMIFKIQRKYARCVVDTLRHLQKALGGDYDKIFKTITVDNGSEFSDTKGMETENTPVYYCHPYSSWERGTNENINKMIRRHIPKGKSMNKVTKRQVQYIQNWINDYPREILGWQTASEVFLGELSKQGIDISYFVQNEQRTPA